MFRIAGKDVEEDGFEWRVCSREEDMDWGPTKIDRGTSSEGNESKDSNADDVVH